MRSGECWYPGDPVHRIILQKDRIRLQKGPTPPLPVDRVIHLILSSLYMPVFACRGCGVSRTARAATERALGQSGPNLYVDESCSVCGLSLLWAVWAGLVDIHPKYLAFVLTPHFAKLVNRDADTETLLVCDQCKRMDRSCDDCASDKKRAAWNAVLDQLDAMNYEASSRKGGWGAHDSRRGGGGI